MSSIFKGERNARTLSASYLQKTHKVELEECLFTTEDYWSALCGGKNNYSRKKNEKFHNAYGRGHVVPDRDTESVHNTTARTSTVPHLRCTFSSFNCSDLVFLP